MILLALTEKSWAVKLLPQTPCPFSTQFLFIFLSIDYYLIFFESIVHIFCSGFDQPMNICIFIQLYFIKKIK